MSRRASMANKGVVGTGWTVDYHFFDFDVLKPAHADDGR